FRECFKTADFYISLILRKTMTTYWPTGAGKEHKHFPSDKDHDANIERDFLMSGTGAKVG
ncbi:MAG: hypothetical protein ACK559_37155, partial [bacterium]